jgi:predicted outer membrane protein
MRAYFCSIFGVVAVCGLSWGQAPPANPRAGANEVQDRPAAGQPPRTTAPARGNAVSGSGSSADRQIAACLYLDSHKELELARFAQSKLQTEQAKQFAEKMIREHTPGHEIMKRFAGELVSQIDAHRPSDAAHDGRVAPRSEAPREGAAATRQDAGSVTRPAAPPAATPASPAAPGSAPRDPAPRPAAPAGTTEAQRTVAGGPAAGGSFDWVSLHKELGEKCLASTKKALSEHQGADFDKAYMTQQTMAHMEMVDKLSVFRNHVSGELQQHLDKELQTATAHLQQAKQIKEQWKDAPAERSTRKPE